MSMTASEAMRASDRERDQAVEFLTEQTAQGRLSLQELEQRTGAAYAAKTRFELQQLIKDLPGAVVFERGGPGARTEPGTHTERAPTRRPAWLVVLACCCGGQSHLRQP